jgi:hypothetical protein
MLRRYGFVRRVPRCPVLSTAHRDWVKLQDFSFRMAFLRFELMTSLEYTNIPKVFFTPHHRRCRQQGKAKNVIVATFSNKELGLKCFNYVVPTIRWTSRETAMDRPKRCSSLLLKREQNIKSVTATLTCCMSLTEQANFHGDSLVPLCSNTFLLTFSKQNFLNCDHSLK